MNAKTQKPRLSLQTVNQASKPPREPVSEEDEEFYVQGKLT